MFGFKGRKGTVHLEPREIREYSDTKLHSLFVQGQWRTLDKATRLAALQEVENRRARLDGRRPIPVVEGKSDVYVRNPGLMGGYVHQEKVIRINYRFLEDDSIAHSGMEGLDTILHEGRHAFQFFTLEEQPGRVSEGTLLEWLSSFVVYFDSSRAPAGLKEKFQALYMLQAIESDARRFARNQMLSICSDFEKNGISTRDAVRQLRISLTEEIRMIALVKQTLTLPEINDIEKAIREKMQASFPELDISALRLFDNARLILSRKLDTLDDYIDLVRELDERAQRKMDTGMDRPGNLRVEHIDKRSATRL